MLYFLTYTRSMFSLMPRLDIAGMGNATIPAIIVLDEYI